MWTGTGLSGPHSPVCHPWTRCWPQQKAPCSSCCVPVTSYLREFESSVPSACPSFYLLCTKPQPLYPSGFLLKCHFFLTSRCILRLCAFPVAALLPLGRLVLCDCQWDLRLSCYLVLSMRMGQQGPWLACSLLYPRHLSQGPTHGGCFVSEGWMNGWMHVEGEIPLGQCYCPLKALVPALPGVLGVTYQARCSSALRGP